MAATRLRHHRTNGPIGWHSESLWHGEGVIVGRKGAYREVHYSPLPFFVIDTAFFLVLKESFSMKWAFHEVSRIDFNGMDSGSAIPSTSRDSFSTLDVCLPPVPVMDAFEVLVAPGFARRVSADCQNQTLAALRDALLPRLLSGELRVKDAERIAEVDRPTIYTRVECACFQSIVIVRQTWLSISHGES